MNTETTEAVAAQDAAAEAPDVPASAPGASAGAGQKRTRRTTAAAKGSKPAAAKPKGIAPTMREITVDGQTVKVAITLSDEDAEKYARKLINRKANAAVEAPDVDRKPTAKAKPKSAAPKVEDGQVAIRLSKTAWEQAFAGKDGAEWRKANAPAWKVLKGAKARSVGSSIAYFATVKVEDADEVVAHLKATAKVWEKQGKSRTANPAPLVRNAAVIAGQVKAAK